MPALPVTLVRAAAAVLAAGALFTGAAAPRTVVTPSNSSGVGDDTDRRVDHGIVDRDSDNGCFGDPYGGNSIDSGGGGDVGGDGGDGADSSRNGGAGSDGGTPRTPLGTMLATVRTAERAEKLDAAVTALGAMCAPPSQPPPPSQAGRGGAIDDEDHRRRRRALIAARLGEATDGWVEEGGDTAR